MSTLGRFRKLLYPNGIFVTSLGGFSSDFDMKGNNTGACIRFRATNTKDIKSVRLWWGAFTVGTGTMTLRIETIDTATGKPTGTLYDANAVIASITPIANTPTIHTFSTLPTTGLVVGQEYGVLLLTTAAFTVCNVRIQSANNQGARALTAADGTTRANFAEVANQGCFGSFVLDDDSEDPFNCHPFQDPSNKNIYGTVAAAAKINVYHTLKVIGYCGYWSKTGTPAGDLRLRLMDSSDNVVAGTTLTLDKDSMIGFYGSGNVVEYLFGDAVTINPGVYRIVGDSASSANTSNCWVFRNGNPLTAGITANKISTCSTTTDITAGPITWVDDATGLLPSTQLVCDDILTPVYPALQLGL